MNLDGVIRSLAASLDAAGGSLAVAFIISLAAGIVAMTLVYLGSALLVLDRFARVTRGWPGPLAAAAVVIGTVSLMATVENFPADAVYTWDEWRASFLGHLGAVTASCVFFILLAKGLIHFLSQGATSRIATTLASLGVGLLLGTMGSVAVPASALGASLSVMIVC